MYQLGEDIAKGLELIDPTDISRTLSSFQRRTGELFAVVDPGVRHGSGENLTLWLGQITQY